MFEDWNIGVVIPARNEEEHIEGVVSGLPDFIDKYVIIDDGSSDATAQKIAGKTVIRLEGEGVGAAIDCGHQWMQEHLEPPFISIVMAGDGQMDPNDLENLMLPIVQKRCGYVKGNRKAHENGLKGMPLNRRLGTFLLTILTTLACGRSVPDPQCGYTAVSHEVIKKWNWKKSWRGYGYPNWWLMELTRRKIKFEAVPVRSIYEGQKSGLKILTFLKNVAPMLAIGLHKRALSWIQNDIEKINLKTLGIPIGMMYFAGWGCLLINLLTLGQSLWILMGITFGFWTIAHLLDRKWVKIQIASHNQN